MGGAHVERHDDHRDGAHLFRSRRGGSGDPGGRAVSAPTVNPRPYPARLAGTVELAAERLVLREVITLADQVSGLTDDELRTRLLWLADRVCCTRPPPDPTGRRLSKCLRIGSPGPVRSSIGAELTGPSTVARRPDVETLRPS